MVKFFSFILFSAFIAITVSETVRYVTEIEFEDDGEQQVEIIESEGTWQLEELFVECDENGICYVNGKPPKKPKDDFNVFSREFQSIGGNVTSVSSRGKEVWVTKKDDSIHRFKNGKWQRMPGAAVNVAASPDGWAWCVNRKDAIFRFNPNKDQWEKMPGLLVQVSALSKDEAIGVNRQRTVYVWKNNAWQAQPRNRVKGLGNGAVWTSIGQNDERWAIGPYTGIWRWNHQAGKWVAQPGGASTVDVHSPGRIIVTNRNNKAFTWVAGKRKWQPLAGKVARRATVGDDFVITLDVAGFLSVVGF